MTGRPRTPVGAHGKIHTKRIAPGRVMARTRVRDLDGRLRDVKATGSSASTARNELQERLRHRAGYGRGGVLNVSKVRSALEVLLGTGVRPGEVLALRPVDIEEGRRGMVAHIAGTVVYRKGSGTFRQPHPKTNASIRRIAVPKFAAAVIRRRLQLMKPEQSEWTIFHNRDGGPLSQHNFRRTFRAILEFAGLEHSGITPRWYRRTGATVIARGVSVDAAASYLGHSSKAITEGHYIEPETGIDFAPAEVLELTLRPVDPAGTLLADPETDEEEAALDELTAPGEEG